MSVINADEVIDDLGISTIDASQVIDDAKPTLFQKVKNAAGDAVDTWKEGYNRIANSSTAAQLAIDAKQFMEGTGLSEVQKASASVYNLPDYVKKTYQKNGPVGGTGKIMNDVLYAPVKAAIDTAGGVTGFLTGAGVKGMLLPAGDQEIASEVGNQASKQTGTFGGLTKYLPESQAAQSIESVAFAPFTVPLTTYNSMVDESPYSDNTKARLKTIGEIGIGLFGAHKINKVRKAGLQKVWDAFSNAEKIIAEKISKKAKERISPQADIPAEEVIQEPASQPEAPAQTPEWQDISEQPQPEVINPLWNNPRQPKPQPWYAGQTEPVELHPELLKGVVREMYNTELQHQLGKNVPYPIADKMAWDRIKDTMIGKSQALEITRQLQDKQTKENAKSKGQYSSINKKNINLLQSKVASPAEESARVFESEAQKLARETQGTNALDKLKDKYAAYPSKAISEAIPSGEAKVQFTKEELTKDNPEILRSVEKDNPFADHYGTTSEQDALRIARQQTEATGNEHIVVVMDSKKALQGTNIAESRQSPSGQGIWIGTKEQMPKEAIKGVFLPDGTYMDIADYLKKEPISAPEGITLGSISAKKKSGEQLSMSEQRFLIEKSKAEKQPAEIATEQRQLRMNKKGLTMSPEKVVDDQSIKGIAEDLVNGNLSEVDKSVADAMDKGYDPQEIMHNVRTVANEIQKPQEIKRKPAEQIITQKKKRATPRTLLAQINKRGGINPGQFKGEFDLIKESNPQMKLLRTSKGQWGVDQMAQMLHDDGYLPDAEPQTLMDALSNRDYKAPILQEEKAEKGTKQVFKHEVDPEFMPEGQEFIIDGEKFKITDIAPDGTVTVKDGTTKRIQPGETLEVDRVLPISEEESFLKPQEIKEKPKKASQSDMFGVGQDESLSKPIQSKEVPKMELEERTEEAKKQEAMKGQEDIFKAKKTSPPLSAGSKVQIGKSPKVYTMIRELEQSAIEKELGERFFEIKDPKTGEVQTVELGDIRGQRKSPTFDTLGGQQIYEAIEGYLKSGKPQQALRYVQEQGRRIFTEGKNTYFKWIQGMREFLGKHYSAFSKQIKGIWDKIKDIQPGLSIKDVSKGEWMKEPVKPFYSKLHKVLSEQLPEQVSPTLFNKVISANREGVRGIKPEEIADAKATVAAIFGDKKTMPKQEILDYLKAVDRTDVQDVTLGENVPISTYSIVTKDGAIPYYGDMQAQGHETVESAEEEIRKITPTLKAEGIDPENLVIKRAHQNKPTHFSQYTEPGAIEGSYREQFVTAELLNKEDAARLKEVDGKITDFLRTKSLKEIVALTDKDTYLRKEYPEFQKLREERGRLSTKTQDWQDGHSQYSGIKNPIVRIRFNDRLDADGNTVRFIEELQGPSKENETKMPEIYKKYKYQIGLKRILQGIAEENVQRQAEGKPLITRLAWTSGDIQAERYDLSKQLSDVRVFKVHDNLFNIKAQDKNGNNVIDTHTSLEKLPDTIGKDLAEKANKLEKGTGEIFSGLDLKVGGTGLKRLYDETIPKFLEKYTGEKITESGISTGKDSPIYSGKEFTSDELRNLNTDKFNASDDQSLKQILQAMRNNGKTFKEAMQEYGSISFSERLGQKGEFAWPDKTQNVSSIPIPESLQSSILGEGQTLFSNPMFNPELIYNTLKGIKGDIQKAMPHLERLGQRVYSEGMTDLKSFSGKMKEYLKDLWTTFSGQMLKLFQKAKAFNASLGEKGNVRAWWEDETPEGMPEEVKRETKQGIKKTPNDIPNLEMSFKDRFRRTYEDLNIILKKFGEGTGELSIYDMKDMLPRKVGDVVRRTEIDTKKFVEDIKKDNVSLKDISDLALAEHAKEYNAKMNQRLREMGKEAEEGLSSMTDKQADETIKRLGNKPKLKKYVEQIRSYAKETNNIAEANGLQTAKEAEANRKMFKNYVPLQRDLGDMEADHTGIGSTADFKGRIFKPAKGSHKDVLNIVSNVFQQREMVLIKTLHNEIGRLINEEVKANPKLAEIFKVQKNPFAPVAKVDMPLGEIAGKTITEEKTIFAPHMKLDNNVIGFKDKGIQYYITMPPDIARAVKNLNLMHMPAEIRFIGNAVRFYAAIKTKYNLQFLPSNLERDLGEMIINSGVERDILGEKGKGLRRAIVKGIPRAQRAIWKYLQGTPDAKVDTFFKEGGDTGHFWMQAYKESSKNIRELEQELKNEGWDKIKNPVKKASEVFDHIQSAVELGTRYSFYSELINRGMTPKKAVKYAADITINFTRQGEIAPLLKQLYVFIGPSIQGASKTLRVITSKQGRKAVMGSILALTALGATMGLISKTLGGDEDDDIPDWVKYNRLAFADGYGGTISLWSMPYSWTPFYALGRAMVDVGYGSKKPTTAIASLFESVVKAWSPVDMGTPAHAIVPTVLKPFAEIKANNKWTGNKVYPSSDTQGFLPNYLSYFPNATKASKATSELLYKFSLGKADIHPDSIDYATRQFFGGPETFLRGGIPFKRFFYRENEPYRKQGNTKDFSEDLIQEARRLNSRQPIYDADIAGKITSEEGKELVKQAEMTDLQRSVYKMPAGSAVKLYENSNKEERDEIYDMVIKKINNIKSDEEFSKLTEKFDKILEEEKR